LNFIFLEKQKNNNGIWWPKRNALIHDITQGSSYWPSNNSLPNVNQSWGQLYQVLLKWRNSHKYCIPKITTLLKISIIFFKKIFFFSRININCSLLVLYFPIYIFLKATFRWLNGWGVFVIKFHSSSNALHDHGQPNRGTDGATEQYHLERFWSYVVLLWRTIRSVINVSN
jgi:hypothetical protein